MFFINSVFSYNLLLGNWPKDVKILGIWSVFIHLDVVYRKNYDEVPKSILITFEINYTY
tara:strand:- start:233814 stop:233990 length:177 start_codon:yes stop_codon:yes gene_type:complete